MKNDISKIILEEVRLTRSELNEHRKESLLRHDGIDKRVRSTERWQSNANGKMTMLGIVGALVGSLITWAVNIYKH